LLYEKAYFDSSNTNTIFDAMLLFTMVPRIYNSNPYLVYWNLIVDNSWSNRAIN